MSRPHWGSRLAFVLAAAGSAVGLGNMWRFPYLAGQNGGGAFVLIYLLVVVGVGLPLLIAELYVGQKGQSNTVDSFRRLSQGQKTFWELAGWAGLLSAFLILSFYSVVGGWVLDFIFRSLLGEFTQPDTNKVKGTLDALFASPDRLVTQHFIFMALTVAVVLGGVNAGLERANKILMPGLFVILLGLLIYTSQMEGFATALTYLFQPDFSKALHGEVVVKALGQAFFSLSLGMGAMMIYGSYLDEKTNLPRTALTVALLDTLAALLSGVVIFAIVFTFNMEPGQGPGLIFVTLPSLFNQMPGGYFISILLFLLVAFASLTSSVSILEVVVAFLIDRSKVSRKKATLFLGALIFLVGLPSALSFNILKEVTLFGKTFFDLADHVTANILLPLGGILISLFFGWRLGPTASRGVVGANSAFSSGLLWTCRILAPLAVLFILYSQVGG